MRARAIKVAMVVTGFPRPGQPNGGIFNLRAAKMLSHKVDVTVVHLRAWKPGRPSVEISNFEGIPVVTVVVPQVPGQSYFNLVLYRCLGWYRIHSLLTTCDLIHSVDAAFSGVLASAWGRRAHVHHLTQIIGSDVNSILPRLHTLYGIAGWERYAHGIACNSDALAQAFRRLYPQARNVRHVYRGVDLQRYCPEGPVAGPLGDQPPVRFLFLGGFPAYPLLPHGANTKGGKTLLAAWQEAERELMQTGASLLIAGPESQTKRIIRWRANLRNPDRVHLAGHLPPDLVPLYIRSSDVVLIPSMEEGLPNMALEASACGRPIFGSKVGGIPEVIVDEDTGLLLPPGDVTAWRKALVAYTAQVSRLRVMGRRARQRMEALFDATQYAPQMLDFYRTVLHEPLN